MGIPALRHLKVRRYVIGFRRFGGKESPSQITEFYNNIDNQLDATITVY